MPRTPNLLDQMVNGLVPSLSRSLAEQFNVFRVMHHGTHEKQLSNVFAWLLDVDGTHEFADAFQRIFVEQVNRNIPGGGTLPTSGYRVIQEVNTSVDDALGKDIADIVLTSAQASIVVENFESSDGHDHDYDGYLAHGALASEHSVVVLLCARRESHRQTAGWEQAAVVTYAEVLESLKTHVSGDPAWRRAHPQQNFFINELVEHFTEGPGAVSKEDRIAFIKTMCDTGESARFGYQPHGVAAREFAELLAQHAQRQFEDGRATLADVKKALRRYAAQTLVGQVNDALPNGHIASVRARFSGQWEWCVSLERADAEPTIFLEFGPTAVVENNRVREPMAHPDYTKVIVTRAARDRDAIDHITQSEVGLEDVMAGLGSDDTRLRDAVLAAIHAN